MSSQQGASKYIVIGAGPVGLATALLLNKLGLDVTVFESQNHISDNSPLYERCPIGLHERGLLCLETIDKALREKISNLANCVTKKEFSSENITINDPESGLTYFTTRRSLTNILYELCQLKKIPIQLGASLLSVECDKKILNFCDKVQGGKIQVVDCCNPAKRIVSCDGNGSVARASLEYQVTGLNATIIPWQKEYRSIIVNFDASNIKHDLDSKTHYIMNGHSIFLATDSLDKNIWIISLSIDSFQSNAANAPSNVLLSRDATDENIQCLKKFINDSCPRVMPLLANYKWADFFKSRPYKGSIVKLSKLNVDEWVLFSGDAAHTLLPLENNEGINVGLEDAYMLYKTISECRQDTLASQHIFANYNEKRQEDIRSLVEMSEFMNEATGKSIESYETKSRYLGYQLEVYLRKFGILKTSSMDLFSQKSIVPYSDISTMFFKRNKMISPVSRLFAAPVNKLSSYYNTLWSYLPSLSTPSHAQALHRSTE